jgi:hypothetical protein
MRYPHITRRASSFYSRRASASAPYAKWNHEILNIKEETYVFLDEALKKIARLNNELVQTAVEAQDPEVKKILNSLLKLYQTYQTSLYEKAGDIQEDLGNEVGHSW